MLPAIPGGAPALGQPRCIGTAWEKTGATAGRSLYGANGSRHVRFNT